MCVYAHVCGSQRLTLGVFSNTILGFETVSLTNLKLTHLARLAA